MAVRTRVEQALIHMRGMQFKRQRVETRGVQSRKRGGMEEALGPLSRDRLHDTFRLITFQYLYRLYRKSQAPDPSLHFYGSLRSVPNPMTSLVISKSDAPVVATALPESRRSSARSCPPPMFPA